MRFFTGFRTYFVFGSCIDFPGIHFWKLLQWSQHQSNMWGSNNSRLGTRDRQCVMGLSGTFAVFFSHYCLSINETFHNLNQFVSIEAWTVPKDHYVWPLPVSRQGSLPWHWFMMCMRLCQLYFLGWFSGSIGLQNSPELSTWIEASGWRVHESLVENPSWTFGVPEEASVFKLTGAITQGGWNAPKDATSWCLSIAMNCVVAPKRRRWQAMAS